MITKSSQEEAKLAAPEANKGHGTQCEWDTMYAGVAASYHNKTTNGKRKRQATVLEKQWVEKQRKEYVKYLINPESSSLTPERAEKLNVIHFKWKVEGKMLDIKWEKQFLEYKKMAEQNNGKAPSDLYKTKTSLYRWAATQRHQYKRYLIGAPSWMTPYRVKKLNEIGFEWTKLLPATTADSCVSLDEYDTPQESRATKLVPAEEDEGIADATNPRSKSPLRNETVPKLYSARAELPILQQLLVASASKLHPNLDDMNREQFFSSRTPQALTNTATRTTDPLTMISLPSRGTTNPLDMGRFRPQSYPLHEREHQSVLPAPSSATQTESKLLRDHLLQAQLQRGALGQRIEFAPSTVLANSIIPSEAVAASSQSVLNCLTLTRELLERRKRAQVQRQIEEELLAASKEEQNYTLDPIVCLYPQQNSWSRLKSAQDLLSQSIRPVSSSSMVSEHPLLICPNENNRLLPTATPLLLSLGVEQHALACDRVWSGQMIKTANDLYVPTTSAGRSDAGSGTTECRPSEASRKNPILARVSDDETNREHKRRREPVQISGSQEKRDRVIEFPSHQKKSAKL